tara:strand:+ start:161 stop:475 length:315 start_codon:yes stop_codon:yes gene_type:complete
MTIDKKLWEILVPRYSNDNVEYAVEYHHQWDEKVREISGGLTILRTAKGHWVSDKDLFVEEMIPVKVYCDRESIDRIIDITIEHYQQKAVMAYEISSNVILKIK